MLVKTEIELVSHDEVFKFIPETCEKYAVSNYGRVLSVSKDKLIALSTKKDGYVKTCIRKGKNNRTHVLVHRLVAEAFCKTESSDNVVNHIDNCRSNNYWENLEFTTTKGNVNHAVSQDRMNYQKDPKAHSERLLKGNETQITNAVKWKSELVGKSLIGSTVVDIQFVGDFSSKVTFIEISCNSCKKLSRITNSTFKTQWHKRGGKLPYCRACVVKGLAFKV